jgi:hypothetical protein
LAHFRAYNRLAVTLAVEVTSLATGTVRDARVVDLGLGGAGLEAEGLRLGERISVTLSTPLMWDPLVIEATVKWVAEPPTTAESGHGKAARTGVQFEYQTPELVLAVLEMLSARETPR